MARREIGEINAGSMADIAFLLLIFFLVTTTMEVDAGIGVQLPLKLDNPIPPEDQPEVIERNVLEIMANSNDELLVEGDFIRIEELEDIVFDFYTANKRGIDENPNMPMYTEITQPKCTDNIAKIESKLEGNEDDKFLNGELSKWKAKLVLCKEFPEGKYMEMNKSALIQLKNQAGTSYGLYIEIRNILTRVINSLRVEACEDMGWGDYFELDKENLDDQEKIKMLRILVPERIIEAKIER